MDGKTLILGKYVVRICLLLYAPILIFMFLPSIFVATTTAEDITDDFTPSNRASLSASLSYEVENYLPTDKVNLIVETDNTMGYKVIREGKTWSIIPEYTADPTTISDITYLQEMTTEICHATPTPSAFSVSDQVNANIPEATLIDSRDNSSYTVRKLADGKCWMTQNLRLNLVAGRTLTSADTDTVADYYIDNNTQTNPGPRWGSTQPTEEEVETSHSYSSHNIDYGNYYNWYAATAGAGKYYMSEKYSDTSICPKGWQLPRFSSYENLLNVYNLHEGGQDTSLIDLLSSSPLSFALAGDYYYNGIVGGQDEWADYWTSDVANLVAASFDVEHGEMSYNHKTAGLTVRCIAR